MNLRLYDPEAYPALRDKTDGRKHTDTTEGIRHDHAQSMRAVLRTPRAPTIPFPKKRIARIATVEIDYTGNFSMQKNPYKTALSQLGWE